MIEINYRDLNPDTLDNLLREIVLREGTEYGEEATTTDEKVAELHVALETSRAIIVFSAELGFCDVLPNT